MKSLVLVAAFALLHVGGAHGFSLQTPSFLGFLNHPEHGHEEHHGGHAPAHSEHSEHHAEHAEHGEHGHHHMSPEEEALSVESFSLALFLMGGVAALMLVFYLVHSPFEGIKLATWRVLNMTASIFVAVLIYSTLKMVIIHIFEPSFHELIGITLFVFVVFYVVLHVLLWVLKEGDKMRLQCTATIFAHITGFAAMYGFADCQEVETFEELGGSGIVMLIVSTMAVICILSYVMDTIMQRVSNEDGVVDEDEKEWIDTCEETDDDVFCLATSFLIVLYFRFWIRGKAQPYEPGKAGNVTQSDSNYLLMFALGFFALTGVGTAMLIKYQALLNGTNSLDKRITTNVQHLNSMIMAWSFLFWAEWQLYVWGWDSTVIGGCLVCACFLTFFSFVSVFALVFVSGHVGDSKMAQRAINSLELALGVLVGFSWERAFDVGFEDIEHAFKHRIHTGFPAELIVSILSLVLLVIVGPAWRYYIAPKAAQLEAEAAAK